MPDLTTQQIAVRFNVTTRTARYWLEQGLLPGARREFDVGWMVPETAVVAFVRPTRERPKGKGGAK